jgi:hypothetical protein
VGKCQGSETSLSVCKDGWHQPGGCIFSYSHKVNSAGQVVSFSNLELENDFTGTKCLDKFLLKKYNPFISREAEDWAGGSPLTPLHRQGAVAGMMMSEERYSR